MAVLSVKTFKTQQQEALLLLHDARREMLRVEDSRTAHIFEVAEGPDDGNVSITIEYADMNAFRAKEQVDPGWQASGERANGPERPAETLAYY